MMIIFSKIREALGIEKRWEKSLLNRSHYWEKAGHFYQSTWASRTLAYTICVEFFGSLVCGIATFLAILIGFNIDIPFSIPGYLIGFIALGILIVAYAGLFYLGYYFICCKPDEKMTYYYNRAKKHNLPFFPRDLKPIYKDSRVLANRKMYYTVLYEYYPNARNHHVVMMGKVSHMIQAHPSKEPPLHEVL
jgi:hypothetical protein